jgi:serine phosphatase RsbU (regulator of sigma subunit)/pSer/pThr/pTyr-binding forkhead associated (FHA) protein
MLLLRVLPAQGEPYQHRVKEDQIVIGRSSDTNLPIPDRFLSRRHARFFRRGDDWVVEDLGSRNGTLLNGNQVDIPQVVARGDRIQISGSVLTVLEIGEMGETSEFSDSGLSHATILRPVSDLIEDPSTTEAPTSSSPEALRRYAARLKLVNDVHQALARSIDLRELLDLILERAFEQLQPEEGAVYLRSKEGEYRRAASRTTLADKGDYLYSKTLVREVAEKGMAALVLDTQTDERFGAAESILGSGVRSLAAAPLMDPEGSLGMIALNSRLHRRQFTEEDLELLVTLASVAALRIRNVALAEEAAERRLLEEELALARQIQVALLPRHLPEVDGYEIFGQNLPSRTVSGDFFEVVTRRDGEECVLLMADVSGKGVAASLLTASFEALAAGPIEVGYGPDEICDRVSRRLHERTPPAKYATAWIGVLTPTTGLIWYSNAGHPPALLVRLSGEIEELESKSLPIGLMPTGVYQKEEATLEPGDMVVIYTDGFTEAENAEGEEYGTERLGAVCREGREQPLEELIVAIDEDLARFTAAAPPADDRTIVMARRHSG